MKAELDQGHETVDRWVKTFEDIAENLEVDSSSEVVATGTPRSYGNHGAADNATNYFINNTEATVKGRRETDGEIEVDKELG